MVSHQYSADLRSAAVTGGESLLDTVINGAYKYVGEGAGAVLGGAAIYLFASSTLWLRRFKKSHSLTYQLAKAKAIQELLVEVRLRYDADRAYVFQFSNGKTYANDVSQYVMTCTHESVKAGVMQIGSSSNGMLVSQYPELFHNLLLKGCAAINTHSLADPNLQSILSKNGVKHMVTVAFTSRNGKRLEGFIGLDWNTKDQGLCPCALNDSEDCCRCEDASELGGFAERIGFELRN